MVTVEIQTLEAARDEVQEEHRAGAGGTAVARRLAAVLDDAVSALWGRLGPEDGCAVVALGEYGRREIAPASSVDLLVLHAEGLDPREAAQALSRELRGAELDLGYAVLTAAEALRLARTRVDTELRFVDARLVAGDRALFDAWRQALLGASRRSLAETVERVGPMTQARRSSTNDACGSLEPDVMDGAGGLADLAAIGWIQAVAGPLPLAVAPADLDAAADLLHRVRNELHSITGRCTDVFQMQHHTPVAAALALGGRDDDSEEVRLLRRIYESGRAIAFALDSLLDAGAAVSSAEAFGGQLTGGVPWEEPARTAFLDLLDGAGGPSPQGVFEALQRSGVLGAALPEWAGIRCLPQRSVYHRHAVDTHSFEVVAELASLAGSADAPTRRVAAESEPDRRPLLLAGLIHDIGKGSPDDHSERGEALARGIVDRMGLPEPDASDVVWLVRHHLLLSRLATRRDLGDEMLALELADRVGSERRLRLLYLLTVADARATGPGAWNTWKGAQISRLYARVNHVLRREELADEESGLADGKAERLRALLDGYLPAAIERHLATMPRSWLAAQGLRDLADQTSQMLEFRPEDELHLRAVADLEAGVWRVTVVANDRPGLFSRVSGVLALHGLNVLGAEAYTRSDGVALEVFSVVGDIDEGTDMTTLTADARRAVRGRLSLDARLDELRRTPRPGPLPAPPARQPEVEVDDEASDFYSVVEVRAADRVGLLYTVTRALVEMELDIHVAKVATYGEEVVDVFYVRDVEGQKIGDPGYAAEIVRAIRHRLAT